MNDYNLFLLPILFQFFIFVLQSTSKFLTDLLFQQLDVVNTENFQSLKYLLISFLFQWVESEKWSNRSNNESASQIRILGEYHSKRDLFVK